MAYGLKVCSCHPLIVIIIDHSCMLHDKIVSTTSDRAEDILFVRGKYFHEQLYSLQDILTEIFYKERFFLKNKA